MYFIECIKDDCGWGTIKNQPEFNQSMEAIVSWFEGNSKLIGELKGVDRKTYSLPLVHDKQESYRVYKTSFNLSYSIIPIARSTHTVLMYPIGYDSEIGGVFDDYEARGFFDKTLNNLSFYLLIICIILSLFSLLYLKYLFIMDE